MLACAVRARCTSTIACLTYSIYKSSGQDCPPKQTKQTHCHPHRSHLGSWRCTCCHPETGSQRRSSKYRSPAPIERERQHQCCTCALNSGFYLPCKSHKLDGTASIWDFHRLFLHHRCLWSLSCEIACRKSTAKHPYRPTRTHRYSHPRCGIYCISARSIALGYS
jgi:hypothetical protein